MQVPLSLGLLLNYLGIGYWPAFLIVAPLIVGFFWLSSSNATHVCRACNHLDHLYASAADIWGLALIIQGLFRNYYGISSDCPIKSLLCFLGGQTWILFVFPHAELSRMGRGRVCSGCALPPGSPIEKTRLGAYLPLRPKNPTLVGAFA